VEFVGHPLLDQLQAAPTREAARRALGIDDRTPVVGLLPGSRHQEIVRVLPVMRDAARHVLTAAPGTRFVLGLAPTIERRLAAHHLDGGPPVEIVPGQPHAVIRAADLLLVTSGTVTQEAALLGTPMVVCYRLSFVSELLEALRLLTDAGARATQRAAFSELAGQLGEPGVGTRAARFVLAQAGAA